MEKREKRKSDIGFPIAVAACGFTLLIGVICCIALAGAEDAGLAAKKNSATELEDLQDNTLTFTMDNPAPYPVLNAIVDNPQSDFADERDSLKIMEYGAAGTSRDAFGHYATDMTLEVGRQYSLVIHVHNDADGELGEDGIAENVQFTLNYPVVIDGDASLSALLAADNTTPLITGSSINLHTDEELRLKFVNKSGEPLPVKRYNYALKDECKLAVVASTDHGTGTITGNVGSLMPGHSVDSGAYIFLWFRVETVVD